MPLLRNNVFGIQTGVAISFLVKRAKTRGCRIHYARRPQLETAEEKLGFLGSTGFNAVAFDDVEPNESNDWINHPVNEFLSFLPIGDRATKSVRVARQEQAIFRLYSLGISTNRDEWVHGKEPRELQRKVEYLVEAYDQVSPSSEDFPNTLKWSRNLKRRLYQKRREKFEITRITKSLYRPYSAHLLYQSDLFIDEAGSAAQVFPKGSRNRAICVMSGDRQDFAAIATDLIPNLNMFSADAIHYFPRKRFDQRGVAVENITDWALDQFRAHYEAGAAPPRPITKDAIFHYVYGVLHDPVYREKYALNLKREFPRIPFYADFWRWAEWGERLMALHIGYETVEPWPLRRIDVPDQQARKAGLAPRALLRADKSAGAVVLDSETQLTGIPAAAWDYRLGNRSALEWVLDQHKEKTPRDPTIREKFNTYQFADYKDKVIDLLGRVTRVSVETMEIVAAMRAASGSA